MLIYTMGLITVPSMYRAAGRPKCVSPHQVLGCLMLGKHSGELSSSLPSPLFSQLYPLSVRLSPLRAWPSVSLVFESSPQSDADCGGEPAFISLPGGPHPTASCQSAFWAVFQRDFGCRNFLDGAE